MNIPEFINRIAVLSETFRDAVAKAEATYAEGMSRAVRALTADDESVADYPEPNAKIYRD